ncbi:hypothetical protein ACHAXT_008854 [Thalassiosira profunda]
MTSPRANLAAAAAVLLGLASPTRALLAPLPSTRPAWRGVQGTNPRTYVTLNVGASEVIDEGVGNTVEPLTVNGTDAPSPPTATAKTQQTKPPFPLVLWRFTRPHTLIGSAIAVPSIFLLAAPTYSSFFTGRTLAALLYAAFPALLMNLYITGLNQITDVEIDKINKPELPMAKGDLDYPTATFVVLASLIVSLAMSIIHPTLSTPGLQLALWGSFVLGTLYSLPPFRMKRHPLLAATCIVAVRGTIINAGFYSHALSAAFGGAAGAGALQCLVSDWKCGLSSLFFGIFGIVIALMKDVPDAHGDRIFNIRSFTVRLGQGRVFQTMKNLLISLFGVFGGALLRWATMAPDASVAVRRGLVALGCGVAGWTVNREAREVNPEDSGEVYSYYMYLWKLFYTSYLVLPFAK